MIQIQDSKYMTLLAPIAVTSTVTGTAVDSVQQGVKFDYATLVVQAGVIQTTVAIGGLKVQESDDNSNWVDIAGTANTAAITATTDNGKFYVYNLDMKKRRRYIRISLAGTSTGLIACATCILSRAKETPYTPAQHGATGYEVVL
jgi:hypothetical protein